MTSPVATNHLRCNVSQKLFDDDDATAATLHDVSWQDFKNFDRGLVSLMLVAGTGVAAFHVKASASSDGSNPVTVKTHSDPTVADAVGDTVHLEFDMGDLITANAVANGHGATPLRYVSAVTQYDDNADQAVAAYLFTNPTFPRNALTDDVIA